MRQPYPDEPTKMPTGIHPGCSMRLHSDAIGRCAYVCEILAGGRVCIAFAQSLAIWVRQGAEAILAAAVH